jgi:uncharacterized membrane protein
MTLKQFQTVKVCIAMVLAAVMGQAVILNNYILAVTAVIIAVALSVVFRRRVTEVVVDERDYQIAGKAAIYTMQIFCACACVITFMLISLRQKDPSLEVAGSALAYATCAIMLLYTFIYKYLVKRPAGQ